MSIPSSTPGLPPLAALDATRIAELIEARFPQIQSGRRFVIEEVGHRSARVRMTANPRNTRPGGTISGPAMFTLADFSIYVAVIATLGEVGFEAVTSSLNINFLAKPDAGDMVASVRLIRLGRRLAVGEVELYAGGASEMVAHATATYALPISR
jgi:uncharacterized protein (TIGR00369 family)